MGRSPMVAASFMARRLKPNAPLVYYLSNQRWLSNLNQPYYLFFLLLLIPFLFMILIKNKNKWSLALTGFTSSSVQIMLILAFQVYFGYVYQMIGIIFLVFMFGLAMGSGFISNYFIKRKYSVNTSQLLLFILMLCIYSIFRFQLLDNNTLSLCLILFVTFSSI